MSAPVRAATVLLACLALTAAVDPLRAEGLLDEVRREVRESSPGDRDRHDDWDHEYDHHDDHHSSWVGELFGPAILFTVTGPWWLPHFALQDDWNVAAEFSEAPYAHDHRGYLLIDSPGEGRLVSTRLSVEYGNDFGGLSRVGTRLIVDTSSRIGFDTEWSQWTEEVRGGHDSLSTGDFNVIVRFAQDEQIQFRSGLGFNWLADSRESDVGFNLTYGVDLFPRKPWVVSSTLDWGTIGDAKLFRARGSVGVVWSRAEIFAGYDYQRFGGVNLHGPMVGLRFWH